MFQNLITFPDEPPLVVLLAPLLVQAARRVLAATPPAIPMNVRRVNAAPDFSDISRPSARSSLTGPLLSVEQTRANYCRANPVS